MSIVIGNVKLEDQFFEKESNDFSENDQKRILNYLSNPEMSRDKFIMKCASWPLMYHLSHMRSNIIESVGLDEEMTVLEIGSECGAITERLCQLVKHVTCVETSRRKSIVNAQRNKKQNNLEILVGNFGAIEKKFLTEYDVVTMIGSFSLAPEWITEDNPFVGMLQRIMPHIKTGGKLIIGIDNRLGMKYFSGCKEAYSGIYFEGIEGYSKGESRRTFSRKEIVKLITDAGYEKIKVRYPYPDYQFTMDIFSDEHLPEKGQLKMGWFEMKHTRQLLFDEAKAFDSMIDAGLFPEMSNSFLIEIEK